jgi:C-methyltransferase C-terminal domain/Putative zinc binding domain/Methyltransferase domain
MSPLCESYVAADDLDRMEPFYPLRVQVCERCLLVQLQQYVSADDIFTEYAYFSSYSTSWVEHARRYCDRVTARLGLGPDSLVIELASNDGYLLQHLVAKAVPVLGIEPARNVAVAAEDRGVPTITEFFGANLASRLVDDGLRPDLLVANNVLAQVPDVNDFVAGMRMVLPPGGVATVEFPHLARLFAENQFDTIYHEHFSYFSLLSARRIFEAHGLTIFDVEQLATHGGSLRLWLRHEEDADPVVEPGVDELLDWERREGFEELACYLSFGSRVEAVKRRLLTFLIRTKDAGLHTVGYGAPGKGNTLLNYCGIRTDLLDYTVDRNPYKQGRFLPGTHIPIHDPARIDDTHPDYLLILPWNLQHEVMGQLDHIRSWGGRFVVPIPEVKVL